MGKISTSTNAMVLLEALRTSTRLFLGTGLILFIAEVTALTAFSWIAVGMSIWLFLSLYWLGICCIGYWYERESNLDKDEAELLSKWICQCQMNKTSKCPYLWLGECTEPYYHTNEKQLWN